MEKPAERTHRLFRDLRSIRPADFEQMSDAVIADLERVIPAASLPARVRALDEYNANTSKDAKNPAEKISVAQVQTSSVLDDYPSMSHMSEQVAGLTHTALQRYATRSLQKLWQSLHDNKPERESFDLLFKAADAVADLDGRNDRVAEDTRSCLVALRTSIQRRVRERAIALAQSNAHLRNSEDLPLPGPNYPYDIFTISSRNSWNALSYSSSLTP